MHSLKRLALAAALVLTAAFSAPASADQLQDILDRGTIRVGVIADVAPFGFLDDKQQPSGLDVDVANLIANDLGVKLEIQQMTAQNRLPYLVTDKVDILVALLSLTPERAKQVMFTSPYTTTTIGVFGPTETAVKSVADIGKLSIGVTRGTVEDSAITKLAPDANIIRFEDNATATTAYQTGQVDLYATGDLVAYVLNKNDKSRRLDIKFSLGTDLIHMGVKAGEFGTLQWLNSFIFVHQQNGDLKNLTTKWLGTTLPELPAL
ncbi:MAG: transporter substrate-binding domain-containing protein [Parvibaculaceae bacterium]